MQINKDICMQGNETQSKQKPREGIHILNIGFSNSHCIGKILISLSENFILVKCASI